MLPKLYEKAKKPCLATTFMHFVVRHLVRHKCEVKCYTPHLNICGEARMNQLSDDPALSVFVEKVSSRPGFAKFLCWSPLLCFVADKYWSFSCSGPQYLNVFDITGAQAPH